MIIGKDVHPKRKIYYFGALILEALDSHPNREVLFDDVFEDVKKHHQISIELFMLSLDWLYMLNAIEGKDGKVIKCF